MLLKKYEKIRTTKTREVKILTYKKHIHSVTLQILDEIDVAIIIDQSLNCLSKKTVQVFLAFGPCTGRIRVISTSKMVCWWRILSVIFGYGWLNEGNTFRAFDMPIFNRMVRTRKTCTWSVMDAYQNSIGNNDFFQLVPESWRWRLKAMKNIMFASEYTCTISILLPENRLRIDIPLQHWWWQQEYT
jgi:hypothetical protein